MIMHDKKERKKRKGGYVFLWRINLGGACAGRERVISVYE